MSDSESQPMSEDRPKAAHRVDATRFWAVLIGINAYPSSPLRGCVSDVEKMEEFLTKDLGVPKVRIQCLLSPIPIPSPDLEGRTIVEAVTTPIREHIIDTLLKLSTNPQILPGDNIIIYFSGHGSSYDLKAPGLYKPGNISAEGYIKALCPVDRTAPGTDNSIHCIPDISGREINIILAEISHAKGNHITLILDCCYSSGGSRDPSNSVRSADPLPATSIGDMLEAAQTRLRNLSKYHAVLDGNWKPDMTSHVVLAACTETQRAEEVKGADNRYNGIFTQALIGALKSDDLKEESTYVNLITISASMMPPNAKQIPMVAGNMTARLWYQPEVSKKVSSWPGMHVWLLNVVGVGVGIGIGIGLIAWLRG